MSLLQAPLQKALLHSLPARTRPIIRYRREGDNYLAAFPDGHVALCDAEVLPLLEAGTGYEQCRPYFVGSMEVDTQFHFSGPLMAWLEITRECNLTCPHCFTSAGKAYSTEISTERILSLLDEWANMGMFAVVITGGEPTLHRDFLKIVHHAHELGFVIGIASNGLNLKGELLDGIPRDDVIISMSVDELHNMCGDSGKLNFEFVKRRITTLKNAGFNTSIMVTTTKYNIGELQTVIDWAAHNQVSLRSVPFVAMGRGAQARELSNTVEDVTQAAHFWIAEEEWERIRDPELGLCVGKVFNYLLTMEFATGRCMSGRGLCYVTADGDVFPCSNCAGNKILCAGNVQFSSFTDIWLDSWDIRNITWKCFEKTCEGCQINNENYYCTGRCPSSSYALNKSFDGCGMTEFQKASVLARESLFRERVNGEPRVIIKPN